MYADEVLQNTQNLERSKAMGADLYELKKQTQVLDESKRMILELEKKIREHKIGLIEYLKAYIGDEDTTTAQALVQS